MNLSETSRNWHRLYGAAVMVVCLAAAAERANAESDCTGFFPDFRCERVGRYDGFVMPMASPFLFEEPFITTGISAWSVRHAYPDDSVFQGGTASVLALQLRVAVTDRLAFIATKDGFVMHRPDNPLLNDADGFLALSGGFKYALIDMPEAGFIVTPSLRYELASGSSDVFSGTGKGIAIPAVSAAWGSGPFHAVADVGASLPIDGDAQSSFIFYHAHLDLAWRELPVPFVELSGQHWVDSGDGELLVDTELGPVTLSTAQALLGTGGFEGADIVDLGSADVDGADLVTVALGVRIPLGSKVALGAAYEFPVTRRKDIFASRLSANLTVEF